MFVFSHLKIKHKPGSIITPHQPAWLPIAAVSVSHKQHSHKPKQSCANFAVDLLFLQKERSFWVTPLYSRTPSSWCSNMASTTTRTLEPWIWYWPSSELLPIWQQTNIRPHSLCYSFLSWASLMTFICYKYWTETSKIKGIKIEFQVQILTRRGHS